MRFLIETNYKPLVPLLETKHLNRLPPVYFNYMYVYSQQGFTTPFIMWLESYSTHLTHCLSAAITLDCC